MSQDILIEQTEKSHIRISRIKSFMITIDKSHDTFSQIEEGFSLDDYCEKLNDNAEILIVTYKSKDIGLACMYVNHDTEKTLFVSYFGILKEFQAKISITKKLVLAVENMVREKHLKKLLFEVHKDNKACLYLARKHNYIIKRETSQKSTFIYLEKYV